MITRASVSLSRLGGRQSLFLAPLPFGGEEKSAAELMVREFEPGEAKQNPELLGLIGTMGEESAYRKGEND